MTQDNDMTADKKGGVFSVIIRHGHHSEHASLLPSIISVPLSLNDGRLL